MMDEKDILTLLEAHDIRPTSNRILIAKTLAGETGPMSMRDIERKIITIDKSNIFRTLTLFKDHHLVHQIEDGEGKASYELCMRHSHEGDDDIHVHFYCENCHRTFCFTDIPVPTVVIPGGYIQQSANYIVKGLCPKCAKAKQNHL